MDIDLYLKVEIERIVGYTITPMTMTKEDLVEVVENIITKYKKLEKDYEDLEQNLNDNYRPIPVSEQVGISDRDFI